MIDDDRLHDVLIDRASRAPDLDLAAAARAIARQPRTRSQPSVARAGALGVAAALAVALATVGLTMVSSRPLTTHTASPTAASSVRLPAGVEPWAGLTWSAVDGAPFDVPDLNVIWSVVRWDRGFVAAGSGYDRDQDRHTGSVWASQDGRDWELVAQVPDVSVFQIVSWEGELVLVGHYHTPGMWRSADGVAWTEVDLPEDWMDIWQPISIVVGSDDWLVTGVVMFDGPGISFRGRPGGDWSTVESGSDAFVDGAAYDIAATEETWVAVGAAGRINEGPVPSDFTPRYDHGAIWWSTDDHDWTAATVEAPGTYVSDVVRVVGGWLAIGGDQPGCSPCDRYRTLAWRSNDGRSWQRVDVGPIEANVFGGMVLRSDGQRGLIFDTVAGDLRVRETFDGVGWLDVPVRLATALPLAEAFRFGLPLVGSEAIVTFAGVTPYLAVPGPLWP